MADQFTYSTHVLPSPQTSPGSCPPPDFAVLVQKYAAARLEALLTSPNAFASTHAIESEFTAAQWRSQIWREDAVILVCVAGPKSLDTEAPEASPFTDEWVGTATLCPLPASEYGLAPESGRPTAGNDEDETKWHMMAMFASEAHRGRGISRMLIQAGKDYAVERNQADPRSGLIMPRRGVRLRVMMIHPQNTVILALYSKTGFVDVGRATRQEAYRSNGNISAWDLKFDTLTEEEKVFWTTARMAIVLEWLSETRS
ncbi:hypothetical protein DFH07DRAFT_797897 [Mycena maculata]|uniref:N-acetyltransferase domain-containing protein n=1 Tax=Mycena maculata TaxID=230809 RepID=A0AAD7NVH0_9AGAR|nr:hypothetical protein DFH07DRAFT_797897 [Mycena maculata]